MLGDGSARVVLYILGYVVPAYHCFKAIELNQADKTREWSIYWLLLALFTTAERLFLDIFIFWLPFYYEAKVLFVLYLWHPKSQGALYLYGAFVKPFLLSHEGHIDEYVNEAKTWLQDFLAAHFQRLTQLLQSKFHLILAALQNVQQAKVEEVKQSNTRQPRRSASGKIKKVQSTKRKASFDADLLNELPDVPTTKIE